MIEDSKEFYKGITHKFDVPKNPHIYLYDAK